METKICLYCNEEKSLENFGTFKNRDDSIGHRNVCRDCMKKQRREREGNLQIVRKTQNIKLERTLYNMLTEEQIKKLEDLANKHEDILKMLSDRLDLWDIEDIKVNRTQKTLMINTELDKIITEHMKKSRLTYSDVANIAIKKGLEFIK